MENTDLVNKLNELSKYLMNNDKSLESNEIKDLSKKIQDVNVSKEGFEEIKQAIDNRCDIRWLGDIYIKEIVNPHEWWNFLGSVKSLAEKL